MINILKRIFPSQLWGGYKGVFWGLTLLTLLWFGFEWCLESSFTAISRREFWCYNLLVATILAMPVMLWRARKWQAVIITVLAGLCQANLMYSRTYFAGIPARSYLLAGNMTDYSASAIQSMQWYDAGFLLIVLVAWWLSFRHTKPMSNGKRGVYFVYILVLSLFSWIWDSVSPGYVKAFEKKATYKYYSQRVPMYTVFGWLAYDMLASDTPLTAEDKREVAEWLAEHRRLFPPSVADTTLHSPKSVVLVYVESLETWPINLKVEGKEITPRLNRLVGDSTATYIPKVVTQVGTGRSIDTQLLENAGLLPMSTMVWATTRPNNQYFTVNKAFTEATGGDSWYLTTAKPSNWNQGVTTRNFGYNHQLFKSDWKPGPSFGANHKRLGDKPLVEQTIDLMKHGKILPTGKPGFVHLITMSSHHPFMLPEEFDELHLKGDYPEILKGYLETLRYTDSALGELIDYLQSRPDYQDILVVITGDHEGLANNRAALAKQYTWVSSEKLTPWIVLNSPYPGKIDKYVGQIDLYPTMLQLLGLSGYEWQGMGVSALSNNHPGVAISYQGEVSGPIDSLSTTVKDHLQRASKVSNLIIMHNLIKKR